jgi:Ca2+-binding EF-hand superfamily protein
MRQFIRDTLIEMGQVVKERDQFDEGDFNRLFRQFDRKNTGIISKSDLLVFVKMITGLQEATTTV